MEKGSRTKRAFSILLLVLCNAVLIVSVVFYAIRYSREVHDAKEASTLDGFCNSVDALRKISEMYLDSELDSAKGWAGYIEQMQMNREEALAYITALDDQSGAAAHIVDMDTFDAWSTRYINGDNRIYTYSKNLESTDSHVRSIIENMKKIFAGEKCVLSRYKINESQRICIAVGARVTLREEDGSDRDYLLLRTIPVEHMKSRWLFPTAFSSAQIGLIATNYDYVIPSAVMRSETFIDFVRSYNFADDFYGADRYLSQIASQTSGLMQLYDSRGQLCYWYYSRLDGYPEVDILGYLPSNQLVTDVESLSIAYVVAAAMFALILIDGAYILNINRELRKTARFANRASRFKTQFLSTMSHDIRTPLNAVLGMTELAQSKIGNQEYVKECLAKITISGNHLLTLINDILEISRIESGKTNLNPEPFGVRLLVANLESLVRSQATGHGLELSVEIGELLFENLIGDRLRLTQVYLNLLNNAVKYTKAGGKIRLLVREEGMSVPDRAGEGQPAGRSDGDGRVMLTCVVQDNGIGMSEEFQRTMYESFTRVSDARVDKIQGTGLGLAIVRHLVDLMQGTIECESALHVGTTFTVRIPLRAFTGELPEAAGPTAEASDDLLGLHILIAEDNDINWEIISTMLGDYGIVCDRAENGRECVERLLNSTPGAYQLVFMDVQMPLLNGLEATRQIRASGREDLKNIPIAAMTADAFAEDVQECMDGGMNAHISKPIQIDKVVSTIRLLLARARQP